MLHHADMSSIYTAVKAEQPKKASEPIEFTLLGITTEVKPLSSLKALAPIRVTLYSSPSYVTDSGMFTEP